MGLKRKPPQGNVRNVVSMGGNLCSAITNKEGQTVQAESFHERILALLFQRDKSVINYQSQPETFVFTDRNGKTRRYTPDFIVWRRNGDVEIHEVTLTERQEWVRIRERELAAGTICQALGWRYIVHTEQTLPQSTEVANLLALYRYRLKAYAHDAITASAQGYLLQSAKAPLNRCMRYIVQHLNVLEPIVFATLCHLLWHDELCTDLRTLLIVENTFSPRAMVWLPNREEDNNASTNR